MKWLLVKIPLAFLLLFLLGYVMECFWLGHIPTPKPAFTLEEWQQRKFILLAVVVYDLEFTAQERDILKASWTRADVDSALTSITMHTGRRFTSEQVAAIKDVWAWAKDERTLPSPNPANFYLAQAGSGVGILSLGLAVAILARLALHRHQTAAVLILILVSFVIGLLAKTGDLFEHGTSREVAMGHGHSIACGLAYAAVMAAFWFGIKGLWQIGKKPKADERKWALKADRAKRALEESKKDS